MILNICMPQKSRQTGFTFRNRVTVPSDNWKIQSSDSCL